MSQPKRKITEPMQSINIMKRHRLWLAIATFGLTLILNSVPAHAQGLRPSRFNLVPASAAIATCLPNAAATVTVFPREDVRGGYAGFTCRGPAAQYDLCGLPDRNAGASLRRGAVYRRLHHQCGGQRACPRGCHHR